MSTEKKQLTAEQTLMHEVVRLIAGSYTVNQTNLLVTNAKQISDAIMNYKAPKDTEK